MISRQRDIAAADPFLPINAIQIEHGLLSTFFRIGVEADGKNEDFLVVAKDDKQIPCDRKSSAGEQKYMTGIHDLCATY